MHFWAYAATVVSIPICYVGSLYLFDRHQLHTDHPRTVKRRLWGSCLSTGSICIWTYILLRQNHDDPAQLMGLSLNSDALANTIYALGLSATVYLGTFVMDYLDETLQSNLRFDISTISCPALLRNIVFAPLTEELAFRSCLVVLLRLCSSNNVALYLGPMFFSACHYHHIFNDIKHGYTPMKAILERSVQALYTYAFGLYATYLFFGTGNILPSTVVHAFCNCMGLPRVFDVSSMRPKSRQISVYLTHFVGVGLFIYFLPAMG